jgi:hypothetical protein
MTKRFVLVHDPQKASTVSGLSASILANEAERLLPTYNVHLVLVEEKLSVDAEI